MHKIPIDLAEPGMVLAKPIISDKGIQLCAEDTELTASLLERLKRMQISFVMLKGSPVDEQASDESAAEEVQKLNERFIHVKGDPLMERLRVAIEKAIISRGHGEAKVRDA